MNAYGALWPLDPHVVFLNHGSFGSCPLAVLQHQTEMRLRLERQPVTFMVRELEPMLDAARVALAQFVGGDGDDVVLVTNATAGVNAVLRSLRFKPGDELLVSDHEYNACRNALDYVAQLHGARVVVAAIPFPLQSGEQVVTALLEAVTPRTRLLLIDHVSSQTALVTPLAEIVREFAMRGIDTLVDGAHAPGMLPLDLDAIGAAYYTGNCHKWICSPKGAGFLHVRKDRQQQIRPLSISHGANSTREDRSRFQIEFGWTGTWDPTAMLCVPFALEYLGSLLPGGWPELMQRNHALAVAARAVLCEEFGIDPACPDAMIGSMATVPIADGDDATPPRSALYLDRWQDLLLQRWRIEVPIIPWPRAPGRLLRISAQLYNELAQYRLLAGAIRAIDQGNASL